MKVYILNWEQMMESYTEYGTSGVFYTLKEAKETILKLKDEFSPTPDWTILETTIGSDYLTKVN
jgi:hypothetical protein